MNFVPRCPEVKRPKNKTMTVSRREIEAGYRPCQQGQRPPEHRKAPDRSDGTQITKGCSVTKASVATNNNETGLKCA